MRAVLSGLTALFLGAGAVSPVAGPWKSIGQSLPHHFEPSGVAWQPRTERLLVVSDEGTIAEMDAQGGSLRTWPLPGDLEDICIADPASSVVYVAVESPPTIIEYDLAHSRALRSFPLDVHVSKKKGMEALTFLADPSNPEGGLFWAGLQSDGSIVELSVPLRSRGAAIRELRRFTPRPGHNDLAALGVDPGSGAIWAVYDDDDLVAILDKSGRVESTWPLPGKGQEGIAITAGWIFVADDDAHDVMRMDRGPR